MKRRAPRLPALLALLAVLLWLPTLPCLAQAPLRIDRAQAVRADWHSTAPPASGWVPVTLQDEWQKRWPDHDGVVWYRVHWQQTDAHAPTGLLLDYTCLAAAVYVNGSLVDRDPSLVEPLSREWHTPRYYLLDAPLLRAGDNELLVRVSGLSAYQPALGVVTIGAPAQVESLYRDGMLQRRDLELLDTAIGAVLAALFGLFWLLRRQDTTYGWYALNGLFGMAYGYNYIATSPWPFASTDGFQAFIGACYVAIAATYAIFLLRFAQRRWPRFERALLTLAALVFVLALAFPHVMGPWRNVYIAPVIAFHYAASLTFLVFALRNGRRDYRVLALCLMLPIVFSFHDLAVYSGVLDSGVYIGSFGSPLTLLGMGFVLAYRFALTMKRVEGFNLELKREVDAATAQLAATLQEQHALELAHSRAGERLQLVRDLHDGFGGTLVGTIAQLRQAPDALPKERLIAILGDMRDDLRLVIDSTAREHADLAELLVPLRHRASRLLEAGGIDAYWHLHGLEGVDLGSARSLDLLRLLQEALTNVFKHSRAGRVDVTVERRDDRLRLQVRDDGVGVAAAGVEQPSVNDGGAGLASMRLRAQRLGGELQVLPMQDSQAGTELQLDLPIAA